MAEKQTEEGVKHSILTYVKTWGENAIPPTLLATLITAQALRPPRVLPLLFPPVLLFSTYLNLNDYKVDAAGISSAWSGLYILLARRRKQPFMSKWGTRGLIRGTTLGLCGMNLVAGGLVYVLGKRNKEPQADGDRTT